MAGADVIHLCSILLKNGPYHVGTLLKQMRAWMEENEYTSIAQMKGSLSHHNAANPSAYERANYAELLGRDTWLKVDIQRYREE